ncbi:MAG: M50 family metallopeptidase [Verrucomicrobia bacterium]|nr:M50 family metallopeptidase [Verrucomicrobiota bacterium]
MLPSRSGSIPLFRFAGIQVYLHWWWFVFAAVEVTMRSRVYSSFFWNVAEYLALFVIVLLHEFGHSLACRQTGGQADQIVLWPLGGIAFVRPPPRPGAELWSIAAGPLVNVVLVPVLYGLSWARVHLGWGLEFADYGRFLRDVFWINFGLLVFNLLPVYPLDGGQILRSVLWFFLGRARSLQVATVLGAAGIVGLAATLLWLQPERWLITLLMAGFLGQQCLLGFRHAKLIRVLEQMPRHGSFRCPVCEQSPPGGPLWLCPACGNRYDPFSTVGVCPHCATARVSIPCAHCGTEHSVARWGLARAPRPGDAPVIDV